MVPSAKRSSASLFFAGLLSTTLASAGRIESSFTEASSFSTAGASSIATIAPPSWNSG